MKKFAVNLWEIIYPMLIYLIITMIISFGVGLFLGIYVAIINPEITDAQFETEVLKYSLHMTFLAAAVTTPFLVLFKRRDDMKAQMEGTFKKYEKVEWLKYSLVIPFALFAMYASNILVSILMLFMPEFMINSYTDAETAIYGSSFLIQMLAAGIMGPIVEEYIFRGLIYKRCLRFANPIMAGIISAALFGIFHWNWIQLPYAFLLGLALAFVYEKYKNMFAPILLHMVANMFSIIVSAATKNVATEEVGLSVIQQLILYIPMFVATGTVAIVFAVLINRYVNAKEIRDEVIDSGNSML